MIKIELLFMLKQKLQRHRSKHPIKDQEISFSPAMLFKTKSQTEQKYVFK